MDTLASRSWLGNVTWTGNKMVPTPLPVRLFLFACLHRGIPKVLLALAFCFVLSFFFFLRREVTTFFEHSCSLNFVVLYHAIEYTITYFIGSWKTTSWGIYHQAFSVVIPIWSGRMAFETCISSGKFVREINYQRNICKEICQRNYSGIEFRSLNLFLFLK